jgi:hypothetical protein
MCGEIFDVERRQKGWKAGEAGEAGEAEEKILSQSPIPS